MRCTDHFPIDLAGDPYRAKVTQLQACAHDGVNVVLAEAEYPSSTSRTG